MNNSEKNTNKGWECPRCGCINSPTMKKCDCSRPVKEETKPDNRTLLQE